MSRGNITQSGTDRFHTESVRAAITDHQAERMEARIAELDALHGEEVKDLEATVTSAMRSMAGENIKDR
jgi:hypothetical protein